MPLRYVWVGWQWRRVSLRSAIDRTLLDSERLCRFPGIDLMFEIGSMGTGCFRLAFGVEITVKLRRVLLYV